MCDCENEVLTPQPSTTLLPRPECCYEVYMVHAIMAWRMLESIKCENGVHSPFRPERWYDWLRPSEFGHFAGQHLLFFFGAIESNQAANQVGFGFCSWMRLGWLEGWGRVHMHVTSDYFTQWRRGSGRNSEERTQRNHGQETKHHSTSVVDTTAAGGIAVVPAVAKTLRASSQMATLVQILLSVLAKHPPRMQTWSPIYQQQPKKTSTVASILRNLVCWGQIVIIRLCQSMLTSDY
jgi:hypothetical protein